MKKEFFRRGTRMTHRFGSAERSDDPVGSGTFDLGFPTSPSQRSSKKLTVQQHGEHRYCEPLSPIIKESNGRRANINGPAPDLPDAIAQPVPASTKKRKP